MAGISTEVADDLARFTFNGTDLTSVSPYNGRWPKTAYRICLFTTEPTDDGLTWPELTVAGNTGYQRYDISWNTAGGDGHVDNDVERVFTNSGATDWSTVRFYGILDQRSETGTADVGDPTGFLCYGALPSPITIQAGGGTGTVEVEAIDINMNGN